jgi:hypothetical protein
VVFVGKGIFEIIPDYSPAIFDDTKADKEKKIRKQIEN